MIELKTCWSWAALCCGMSWNSSIVESNIHESCHAFSGFWQTSERWQSQHGDDKGAISSCRSKVCFLGKSWNTPEKYRGHLDICWSFVDQMFGQLQGFKLQVIRCYKLCSLNQKLHGAVKAPATAESRLQNLGCCSPPWTSGSVFSNGEMWRKTTAVEVSPRDCQPWSPSRRGGEAFLVRWLKQTASHLFWVLKTHTVPSSKIQLFSIQEAKLWCNMIQKKNPNLWIDLWTVEETAGTNEDGKRVLQSCPISPSEFYQTLMLQKFWVILSVFEFQFFILQFVCFFFFFSDGLNDCAAIVCYVAFKTTRPWQGPSRQQGPHGLRRSMFHPTVETRPKESERSLWSGFWKNLGNFLCHVYVYDCIICIYLYNLVYIIIEIMIITYYLHPSRHSLYKMPKVDVWMNKLFLPTKKYVPIYARKIARQSVLTHAR